MRQRRNVAQAGRNQLHCAVQPGNGDAAGKLPAALHPERGPIPAERDDELASAGGAPARQLRGRRGPQPAGLGVLPHPPTADHGVGQRQQQRPQDRHPQDRHQHGEDRRRVRRRQHQSHRGRGPRRGGRGGPGAPRQRRHVG